MEIKDKQEVSFFKGYNLIYFMSETYVFIFADFPLYSLLPVIHLSIESIQIVVLKTLVFTQVPLSPKKIIMIRVEEM